MYAYKNKKLQNIVDMLIEKSSKKNNLIFDIYDKDNEDKNKKYYKYKNLKYHHIFWDHKSAITYYRNISINNKYDYFFEIGNVKDIVDDWDEILINYSGDNVISIGNNFIDMRFIFTKRDNVKIFKNLLLLKYYGQDLYLYYLLNKNNIKIKYFDYFYIIDEDTLLSSDYIPYSLYHNYNKIIDIIKNDTSFAINDKINLEYVIENNDIEYKNIKYNLDEIISEKFHKPLKTIKQVDSV